MSCARTGALLARVAAAEDGSARVLSLALRRQHCRSAAAALGPASQQRRGLFLQARRDGRPPVPAQLGTRHCSSSNSNNNNNDGNENGSQAAEDSAATEVVENQEQPAETAETSVREEETVVDVTTHDPYVQGLTKVTVPDIFPNVPVIPVTRTPVFPRFVKTLFIRDQRVMDLLTRKCKLGQPYVGVFLRRDDDNTSEVITSVDEVHPVGVFAQIIELQSKGGQMNIVLVAHRRIQLNGEFIEDVPVETPSVVGTETAGADGNLCSEMEITFESNPAPVATELSATELAVAETKEAVEEVEEAVLPVEPAELPPLPPPSLVEAPPFAFLTRVRQPFNPPASSPKTEADTTEGNFPGGEESAGGDEQGEALPRHVAMVTTTNVFHQPYKKRDNMVRALSGEVMKSMREIIRNSPIYRDTLSQVIADGKFVVGDNHAHLADFGAGLLNAESAKLQEVLEELSIPKRLELSLQLLRQELEVVRLQKKLSKDLDEKITDTQRRYHLQEQLKLIKKELGMEKDQKEAMAEKFRSRLEGLAVPEDVQTIIDEELNKLSFLDENSSELNVARNYLEWLTAIRWGYYTDENFEIERAKTILDEDHYGMKPIKERILEFIAVGQLHGSVQGKILFFVGPPGVGKTSIAKSIARSLNRKYFRFSVGGMSDVAEIKGHRRTYVGAMPGKLIQCLKKTEACNPVVVIDEVDKIAHRSVHGDPQSALLEVLDPEQNNSFLDHYLDVPVDLSKILFICTGNSIPAEFSTALLDRMEVIEVSGYMAHEKMEIAKRYLMPKARSESGIKEDQASIGDEALASLIRQYCRESGVRGLQKQVEKIYRKAAFKIVENLPSAKEVVAVDTNNLADFVGKPIYTSDRLYETTPPGVVMGLSWTASGGAPLYLEITQRYRGAKETEGSLLATGSLGNVLKESASIAYSYARGYAHDHLPACKDVLNFSTLHLHCPQGAIPKDGPSAGVAIVSGLLSYALGQPIRQGAAMTGEVSLNGKVLRVGGIKEKVLGARRAGVDCIVMPDENRHDWDELDEVLREGIDVHFVATYADVFPVLFEGYTPPPPPDTTAKEDVAAAGGASSAGEAVGSDPAKNAAAFSQASTAKSDGVASSVTSESLWQSLVRLVYGSPGNRT